MSGPGTVCINATSTVTVIRCTVFLLLFSFSFFFRSTFGLPCRYSAVHVIIVYFLLWSCQWRFWAFVSGVNSRDLSVLCYPAIMSQLP
jgi:hypothetical protein